MRRLARSLFTLCAAVSLVLCVAACVLWVRSGVRGEVRAWRDADCAGCFSTLRSAAGYIQYTRSEYPFPVPEAMQAGHYTYDQPGQGLVSFAQAGDTHLQLPGFRFDDFAGSVTPVGIVKFRAAKLHYGVALLATGPLASAWLLTAGRRRARARAGLCLACGYDLRASAERCPECGAAAAEGTTTGRKP